MRYITPSLSHKAEANHCRSSFYYFVKTFWPMVITGEPVWNWHIAYLCHELQAIAGQVQRREPAAFPYTIINIPPGSTKSTLCSQMYLAWVWTMDATQRFICASHSRAVAEKDARLTRQILESEKYKQLFPHVRLTRITAAHISNSAGGERYATSVGSGITGIHAHQIVVDDPLSAQNAASAAGRKAAINWLDGALSTRKVDKKGTPIILVIQRLHDSDPAGHILRRGHQVKHICLPAEISKNILPSPSHLISYYQNGLLDPVRMDAGVLREMRAQLGIYGYAGQFLQKPAPEEGGLLKKHWFGVYQFAELPQPLVWNIVADTAYTASERNDPSGLLAYAWHENKWYIRDWASVRLEFPELLRFIPEFARRNGFTAASRLIIEPKAAGLSLVQTLRRSTAMNILEDTPPNKDKIARVTDISAVAEAGRVLLPAGAAWCTDFLEELALFPNAAHDEAADCLVMMIHRHLKSSGTWISTY